MLDARGGRAGPGQDAGGQRDRRGAAAASEQPPAEPARAADREREQGLELLVRLLVPRRADLRAGEQADGQDEEEEARRPR